MRPVRSAKPIRVHHAGAAYEIHPRPGALPHVYRWVQHVTAISIRDGKTWPGRTTHTLRRELDEELIRRVTLAAIEQRQQRSMMMARMREAQRRAREEADSPDSADP